MRNHKPSKIWDYNRAQIFTTILAPVKYYMEEEMFFEDIAPMLEDVTMGGFIELYKQYRHNYFKYNTKVSFYTNGADASNIFLLFNDIFFTDFKEDKYYVRTASFKTLASHLVAAHYPNENAYSKAVNYINRYGPNGFNEGRCLISFKFIFPKQ